jgi:hypothetical protein
MYVHFKLHDQLGYEHVGTSRSLLEDSAVISVPVTEEDYVAWIQNPGLARKLILEKDKDSYKLVTIQQKMLLPDMELLPESKDDQEFDVLMVLTDGTVLVHVFNTRMSDDPKVKISYYATEAEDHTSPIFELTASGIDTIAEFEFDPHNIRIVVREPLEGITYGLKIT